MRKNINYILIVMLFVTFSSCEKENAKVEDVSAQIQSEYLEIIKGMEFDETSAVDMGEYILVEGDIIFIKKDLHQYAITRQARTDFLVREDKRSNILIKIDTSMPVSGDDNWRNAIGSAIDEWNKLKSGLYMSLTTSSEYDILIKSDNGSLPYYAVAAAGPPSSIGNPHHSILVNLDFDNNRVMTEGQKKYNIVHELGHCVGLRHTNWRGLDESTGITIPGTPNDSNNPDPSSIMNGGTALTSWTWFSINDEKAIKTLYPGAVLSGPDSFCFDGTYSVSAMPQGYSLSWSWSAGIEPVGDTTGTEIAVQKKYNSAAWVKATLIGPKGNIIELKKSIIYAGAPDFSDDETFIEPFYVNRKDVNIEYDILGTMWTIYKNGDQRTYSSDTNRLNSSIVFSDGFITQSGYYEVGVRGLNDCGWGYETIKILYIEKR